MLLPVEEFLELRNQLPVADVRSEGEFLQGHMAQAHNIPLLNNEERKAVGIDYKTKGQKEAIKTGFRLVGPRLLSIIEETERIADNRELLVHCWRGGMRSNNFCQFVGMMGIKTHSLIGGYKAYRQAAVESFKKPFRFKLLGGFTGSGKSEIIRALKNQGEQVIDLEHLASHKGSAFGGLMMPPQPTTEQFQNDLFEEIRKLDINRPVWVEDEAIAIGKIFLPTDFWQTMNQSPLVVLNVSKEVRIQRLANEYGQADKEEFLSMMGKIVKRLGGQHYLAAREKWIEGDVHATLEILLTYYDKTYHQSLNRRHSRIINQTGWNGRDVDSVAQLLASGRSE
jgi:tRNA 2-selenouridine synthase